ncbi:MAG: hypothetical protein FJ263_06600 [Planctomycetes bacterium]|nr:hypothetical protein [Planctomycetota bacterium]
MESQMETENKPKKTTGCIICGITRWFFIVALGLLLAVGLWFQAPWKILIILAIVLASLTIVPKILRKWVWLGFAVAVAAVIVWIFIPEKDDGQWQPYNLDKEIAAFNAKYAVPDEDNAAVLYTAIMKNQNWEEIDRKLDELGTKDPNCVEHWSDEDGRKLAELILPLEPDLDAIREAAKNSKCRFETHPTVLGLQKDLDRLQIFRRWANILNMISEHVASPQEQIDNGITLLQMGKHLSDQPNLLNLLSGLAVAGTGQNQLNKNVMDNAITLQQIDAIENALQQSKFDMASQWPQILECERFYVKDVYALMYEVHASGKIRFTHGLYQNLFNIARKDPNEFPRWTKFQKKIFPLSMWFVLPDKPDSIFQMIDTAYQPYYAANWSGCFNTKPKRPFYPNAEFQNFPFHTSQWNIRGCVDLLAAMTQSIINNFHYTLSKSEADRRGCLLLCAMQQYRHQHRDWPGKLEDLLPAVSEELLTDPVSQERFVYKNAGDSIILYGKGEDGIDSGGKRRSVYDPNKLTYIWAQDDNLIWPEELPKTL